MGISDVPKTFGIPCTRGITPKCVMSGGAHVRGLAPGQHSSEETPQQWRAVGDIVSDLTGRESNPRCPATMATELLDLFLHLLRSF